MQDSEAPSAPRVIAKIKPQVQIEEGACKVSYKFEDNKLAIYDQIDEATAKVYQIDVDKLLGEQSTIADLYNELKPNVERVIQGYQAAIICYGTVKSGKTYNTFGVSGNEGIFQRAVRDLYTMLDEAKAKEQEQEDRPKEVPESSITTRVFQMYRDSFYCLTPQTSYEMLSSQIQSVSILDKTYDYQIEASDATEMIDKVCKARDKQFKGAAGSRSKSHFVYVIETNIVDYDEGDDEHEASYTVVNGILVITELAGLSVTANIKNKEEKEDARLNNLSLYNLGRVVDAVSKGLNASALFHTCPLTRLLELALGGNTLLDVVLTIRGYDGEEDNEFYKMMYGRTNEERKAELSLIAANSSNESKRLEEVPVLTFGASVKNIELKPEKKVTLLTLEELEALVKDLKKEFDDLENEFNRVDSAIKSAPEEYFTIAEDFDAKKSKLDKSEKEWIDAMENSKKLMEEFYSAKKQLQTSEEEVEKVEKVYEKMQMIDEAVEDARKREEELQELEAKRKEEEEKKNSAKEEGAKQLEDIKKELKKMKEELETTKKKAIHHKTQLERWVKATQPSNNEASTREKEASQSAAQKKKK